MFESYFAKQLEEYVAYRKSLGYAMKSSTMSHLKTFDQYVKKNNLEGKLLLPSFFLELRASLKMEPTSNNHVLSSVCTFFQYLVRRGDYDDNPVKDIPRLPEHDVVPFVFTSKKINQLLSAICKRLRRTPSYYLIDYSRYMAILLIARCGLRISEPLNLRLYHYRSRERTLYIEKTKFRKDRLIPVPMLVATEIENYIKVRRQLLCADNSSYLLVSMKQKRMEDEAVRRVFHRAVKDIGLNYPRRVIGTTNFSSPSPHSLRHAFAVNTLKAIKKRGKSPQSALPVLAVYMGHKSYENTVRYLKVIDARQRHRLFDFAKKHKDEE
jgi:site-specific recombinase XerD